MGVFRTNNWGLKLETHDPHFESSGVFQILSRANHSCEPNAEYDWS